MNVLPDYIRNHFPSGELTVDGRVVPNPQQVSRNAVITMQGCPHTSTVNRWTDSHRQIYFRLRHHKFNKNYQPDSNVDGGAAVTGRSAHPDRGWEGEFLDVKAGATPIDDAIEVLYNPWSEWDGVAAVVAEIQEQVRRKVRRWQRQQHHPMMTEGDRGIEGGRGHEAKL